MKDKYDELIQSSTEKFFPESHWLIIKAQLWQESLLNPNAMSPVGAKGIAQFMPGTWSDIIKQMGFPDNASAFDPDYAIPACCYYMSKLYNKWTAPRPKYDRYALTLSSYNAGFGNLIKAQKLSGGSNLYCNIIEKLPNVTGDNAKETINYVDKIFKYYFEELF